MKTRILVLLTASCMLLAACSPVQSGVTATPVSAETTAAPTPAGVTAAPTLTTPPEPDVSLEPQETSCVVMSEAGFPILALNPRVSAGEAEGILFEGEAEGNLLRVERVSDADDPMCGARLSFETKNGVVAAFDMVYETWAAGWFMISYADIDDDGTDEALVQLDHSSTSGDRFAYLIDYDADKGAFRTLFCVFSTCLYSQLTADEWRELLTQRFVPEYVLQAYSCDALSIEQEEDGRYFIRIFYEANDDTQKMDVRCIEGKWEMRESDSGWTPVPETWKTIE